MKKRTDFYIEKINDSAASVLFHVERNAWRDVKCSWAASKPILTLMLTSTHTDELLLL
jgi:hypothetical protein